MKKPLIVYFKLTHKICKAIYAGSTSLCVSKQLGATAVPSMIFGQSRLLMRRFQQGSVFTLCCLGAINA